jgi:hypothetical protein
MLPLKWIEPPFPSIPVTSPVTIQTTPSWLPWFLLATRVITSVQQFREWRMRTSKRTYWNCFCRRFSFYVMQRMHNKNEINFLASWNLQQSEQTACIYCKLDDDSHKIIILTEYHSVHRNGSNNSHLFVKSSKSSSLTGDSILHNNLGVY